MDFDPLSSNIQLLLLSEHQSITAHQL